MSNCYEIELFFFKILSTAVKQNIFDRAVTIPF